LLKSRTFSHNFIVEVKASLVGSLVSRFISETKHYLSYSMNFVKSSFAVIELLTKLNSFMM